MTQDPTLIAEILRDPELTVVDYRKELGRIGERVDYPFEHSIFALSSVPLALEGDEHQSTRLVIAKRLAQLSDGALAAYEAEIEKRITIFHRAGIVDLTKEFFTPVSSAFLDTLSRLLTVQDDAETSCSQIFDRMLGITRRKKINELLGHMSRLNEHDKELGTGLALQILGGDALPGSLQESFVANLLLNPGQPLSGVSWSKKYIASAVPYVERIVKTPRQLCGKSLKTGERIRVYLDTKSPQTNQETNIFFGVGRHTCLGKQISLQAWEMLITKLSKVQASIDLLEIKYPESDFVFNRPNMMKAKVNVC